MRLVRVDDLGEGRARAILQRANELAAGAPPRGLGGAVLLAFFEPSTRTRLGFARAAADVGAATIVLESTRFGAGTTAPESLGDTLAVAAEYAEVVVIRHPDYPLPLPSGPASVVSAGLGREEHPTQALIDLSAVEAEFGRVDGLRWGIVGDIGGSRSAKSLLRSLRWFAPAEVRLMAPVGREAHPEVVDGLPARQAGPGDVEGLDVLYVAGLPPGEGSARLTDDDRRPWAVGRATVDRLPPTGRILCPMPIIDEIDRRVDDDPRCAWFRQNARGRHVRTAVLEAFWPDRAGPSRSDRLGGEP